MDRKLFVVIGLVLLLSLNVFAANPGFTGDISTTRNYDVAGDRNYYDFNIIFYSPVASDADEDLNEMSCFISFNNGFTYSQWQPDVDFNTDTNRCQANLNYEWGNSGMIQVKFKISDDATNNIYSADANYWLDNTAPVTVGSTTNFGQTLTLTATDEATPTGNGVGVKRIYYKLDSAAWTSSATNPVVLSVSGVGSHTVLFYSTDNFDNNEWVGNGEYWTKPFSVESTDCGLFVWFVPLLCILLAFWIIMRFMNGSLTVNELVGMAIAGIIGIYIIYAFSQGICVL